LIFKWKENLANIIWNEVKFENINEELKFFYEEYARFWWYPKIVLANNVEVKKEYLKQIYDTYIQKDIKDIWKIREVEKFNKTLNLLANQSWNLVNLTELSNTIWINLITLNEWIFLLENTFVIKLIKPFSTNLRWELTKMPKVFFIDNWLRNFCDDDFELSWNTFENSFFEYVNNAYKSKNINFYRTQDKKEIDFILDWNPYELKLSYNWKKSTALDYFKKEYNKKWKVVTLEKSINNNYDVIFPWEV
jgi:predicted AAA+ superfamily ATPase